MSKLDSGLMKKKGILVALIVGVALLASGCFHSNPGTPNGYTEQTNNQGVPRVEANFLDACIKSASPSNCECIFNGFATQVSFKDFESFNNDLKRNSDLLQRSAENDVSVSAKHREALLIIESCRNSCLAGPCRADRLPIREVS